VESIDIARSNSCQEAE